MQRLQAKRASAFDAPKQAEMVGLLLDSLRIGEAVIVLTGPVGSGKTFVVDQMLAQLGAADPALLRLMAPLPTAAELQAQLQAMLGLTDSRETAPADIAQALLMLEPPAPGLAGIVVVLDDAESAPLPLLRYLSLMQALTSVGRAALQLVLVGRETLWQRLGDPMLRELCANVRVRLTMQPFSEAESRDFVADRMRQRGLWLSPDAVAGLVARGAGLPGRMVALIDEVADQSGARGAAERSVATSDLLAGMGMPVSPAAGAPEPAALPMPPTAPGRVRLTYAGCAVVAAIAMAAAWWSSGGSRMPHRLAAVPTRAPAMTVAAQPVVRPPVPGVSREQARLEVAVLTQPAGSLLSQWHGPAAPPVTTALVTTAPVTTAPAASLAKTAGPLLVLADATAPKATVLFTRGDSGSETRAWTAVRTLRQAGIMAVDPQLSVRPAGRPGIGYFFAADRPAAALLARNLAGMLPAGAMMQALPMPPDPPPPGAIRVLMGP